MRSVHRLYLCDLVVSVRFPFHLLCQPGPRRCAHICPSGLPGFDRIRGTTLVCMKAGIAHASFLGEILQLGLLCVKTTSEFFLDSREISGPLTPQPLIPRPLTPYGFHHVLWPFQPLAKWQCAGRGPLLKPFEPCLGPQIVIRPNSKVQAESQV